MIVQLKKKATQKDYEKIVRFLEERDLIVKDVRSENVIVFGVIGDTSALEPRDLYVFESVEKGTRVSTPFKRASRAFKSEDTVVKINANVSIGDDHFAVIAGPCSIESESQLRLTARHLKASHVNILRGGAFKPRTSPYAFQGLGLDGLKIIRKVADEFDMAAISEIMSKEHLEEFEKYVDIIQVGARNMQNFDLLKALGKSKKPILLKRGLSATIEEWLMSAEYLMAEGNTNIILCERGIRTFEKYTRNTLDISAVLAVQELSHLPVIIDPSHASGRWSMIDKLSHASLAVGASGIMVEVHPNPLEALSDGAQSLKIPKFTSLMLDLERLAPLYGKKLS